MLEVVMRTEVAMYARVSTFQESPGQAEQAVGGPVPPEVQSLDGFKGAYALLNRTSGKALLITLWETEEAMQASTEVANRIRQAMVDEAGATAPAMVDMYEVVSQP